MSACAGSLTKAVRGVSGRRFKFASCVAAEWSGPQGKYFQVFRRPGPGWIAPGRIGFMSTQRRENHPTLATKDVRGVCWSISTPRAHAGYGDFRNASRPAGRIERVGSTKTPVAQFDHRHATGTAAPPVGLAFLRNGREISLGTPAAPSLLSDCRNTLVVSQASKEVCHGRSPYWAERRESQPQRLRLRGFSNQSPFPVLRDSIPPSRGYRQH